MSARNRSLSHIRPVAWLLGLVIQLKRAGLVLRRAGAGLLLQGASIVLWPVMLPVHALRWLWRTILQADDEFAAGPAPEKSSQDEPREGAVREFLGNQIQRAGRLARTVFQVRSAWVFATATGMLGLFLMIVLQLMYSFELLGAKESPETLVTQEELPKTRIDPGLPQGREVEFLPPVELAQLDPIAPAEVDPFAVPLQADTRQVEPVPQETEPVLFDNQPPVEPTPSAATLEPLIEPEPFVDPLDNLPTFNPTPQEPSAASDPFASPPPVSLKTEAPTEPVPSEPPAFAPPQFEPMPQQPADSVPVADPMPPVQEKLPHNEPEPFVDPLDNLPPFNPPPVQAEPPAANPIPEEKPALVSPKKEAKPFVHPLKNFPSFNPTPVEEEPPALDALPEANPSPAKPREESEPFVDPLDNLPPFKPMPAQEEFPVANPVPAANPVPLAPPKEPEPFVDPLDNLPPFNPAPQEEPPPVNPRDNLPPFNPAPQEEPPPVNPLDNLPPFNPMPVEEEPKVDPIPATSPLPPMDEPSRNEPQPFVDPLDNLPFNPVPAEEEPKINPIPEEAPAPVMPWKEPEPFVDPLDNLPPFNPVPGESNPMPKVPEAESEAVPETSVDVGVGILRLPEDDDEQFRRLSESARRKEILSQEVRLDAWDHSWNEKRENDLPRPYWERLSPEERERLEQDLTDPPARTAYDPGPEPARTDLNVGIEKHLPPKGTAHEPLKYEIIVENRGREMIDAVDVDEAVPPTHQLTEVSPAGYFESDLLRWRLRELRPGEKRTLSVEVVPTETGTIETTTSVRPSTRVGSLTQVEKSEPPAKSYTLRLRRLGYRAVGLEEQVRFTNHVQNLTGTIQRDLKIVEQIPAGYRVVRVEDDGLYDRQTNTITWTLGELPAGETAKLDVHLKAERTGELTSRIKGRSREGEAVPILARVFVDPIRAERITTPVSLGPSPERCPRCGKNCCCRSCRCR